MNLEFTKRKLQVTDLTIQNDEENDSIKKIKADKNICPGYQEINRDYSELPQEILVLIFKNLSIKERCQMARVCKKWRNVIYDELLWYHVDLSESILNLKKLWNLFRHRCIKYAQSIRICGNLKNPYSKRTQQQSISKALMEKLRQSCLNLKIIEIGYCDLSSINVNDLPYEKLEHLKLIRCEIPVHWFQHHKFKSLSILDLSESSRICTTHLKDIFVSSSNSEMIKSSLKYLIMRRCYRIDDKSIEVLCHVLSTSSNFNMLNLNLVETSITQIGLQTLAKLILTNSSTSDYLTKISSLNIKNCKELKEKNLDLIKSLFFSSSSSSGSDSSFFKLII